MDRSVDRRGYAALFMCVLAILVFAEVLFGPAPRLPLGTVNGVFTNPCCGALALRNGHGSSPDVEFDYIVQKGKTGPLILLDHQNLNIQGSQIQMVSSKGEFLPVADEKIPTWIEVDGIRFVRR